MHCVCVCVFFFAGVTLVVIFGQDEIDKGTVKVRPLNYYVGATQAPPDEGTPSDSATNPEVEVSVKSRLAKKIR